MIRKLGDLPIGLLSHRNTLLCLVHLSWAFVLWRTNGWYSPGWMFALPFLLWISYASGRSSRAGEPPISSGSIVPILIVGFVVLQLLKLQLFFLDQPQSALILRTTLSGILGLGVMRLLGDASYHAKIEITLFFSALIYVCLTLALAPPPNIDVWEFLQISSRAIMAGTNPYAVDYPLGYADKFAPFPYPPAVIFFLAPFQHIFGDVRYGFLAILMISVYLGFIAKNKSDSRYAAAAALLLFPSTVHVLEQSWTDLYTMLPLALVAYSRRSKNHALFYVGVTLLPLIKTYNFLFVPFLLLEKQGARRWLLSGLLSAAILGLLIVHYLPFRPSSEGTGEFIMRMLSPPFVMTEIRHFTLYDWIQSKGALLSTRLTFGLSLLLITIPFSIAFLRGHAISGFAWGSFALMAVFLLYPNTALNYLWIAYVAYFYASFCEPENKSPALFEFDPPTLFFGATRIFVIFGMSAHLSDTGYYFDLYRNFLNSTSLMSLLRNLEYPPLSAIPILFPAIFRPLSIFNEDLYRFTYLILPFLADVFLFALIKKSVGTKRATIYTVLTLFLAELIYDRIDIFVALLIATPLLWKPIAKKRILQDSLIAIGGIFKLAPLILSGLPGVARSGKIRDALLSAIIPITVFIAVTLLISPPPKLVKFIAYHLSRGIQIESLMGNFALILSKIGGMSGFEIVSNFGAQHVQTRSTAYACVAKLITVSSVFGCYGWIVATSLRGKKIHLSLMFSTMITTFVATNTTFSPQFVIWLIPLILSKPRVTRMEIILLTFIAAITGIHFHHYWSYVDGDVFGISAIFVRNALLIALCCVQISQIRESAIMHGNPLFSEPVS